MKRARVEHKHVSLAMMNSVAQLNGAKLWMSP